jgi:hypothetical protein
MKEEEEMKDHDAKQLILIPSWCSALPANKDKEIRREEWRGTLIGSVDSTPPYLFVNPGSGLGSNERSTVLREAKEDAWSSRKIAALCSGNLSRTTHEGAHYGCANNRRSSQLKQKTFIELCWNSQLISCTNVSHTKHRCALSCSFIPLSSTRHARTSEVSSKTGLKVVPISESGKILGEICFV